MVSKPKGDEGMIVYGFMVADLIHEGHIKYIEQSKRLGDYLIIGILTDEAVQTYKQKPLMSLRERMLIVESIKGVDKVVVQKSRDPSGNILEFRPDIVTHGDDWDLEKFPGKEVIERIGAKLVFTKYFKPQSTTKLRGKVIKEARIKETKGKSLTKSVLWRIIGILMLAIITYIYTNSWVTTTLITFFHHFAFIFIYYAHERVWDRIRWLPNPSKKRSIIKVFTYEIVLGILVLGTISWIFTGSFIQVTKITLTYISLRTIGYYLYERMWLRVRWGNLYKSNF